MRQFDNDVLDINVSPISGINDSSYDSFEQSPSYMGGGFAPTVEEPRYTTMPIYEEPISVIAPEPVYEQPIRRSLPIYQEPQPVYQEPQPVYQEPVVSGKCMRVIFSANRGFSAQAFWTDCSGQKKSKFVSVNETLEVDALEGTASGLPFMSYPIGSYEPQPYIPPYEKALPTREIEPAVQPIDEIFLMPVSREVEPIVMPVEPIVMPVEPIVMPSSRTEGEIVAREIEPTPVDAIKTGVMPDDYVESKVDSSPVQTSVTPETPATLPTKGVSKDLKPYIIAGVVVVGILIASRLLSKK